MPSDPTPAASEQSPIFQFADRFVDEESALDPCMATARGVPGFDHLLTDLSPAGFQERADHVRNGLATLATLPVTNDDDRLAKGFIEERFRTALAEFDAGDWTRDINAIAAPIGDLRAIFDLMSRDSEQAWHDIASRLHAVPAALDGLRDSYEVGRAQGTVAARRQAFAAAEQCATWADDRWFDTLAEEAAASDHLPDSLQERIAAGADRAIAAYGAFAAYLRDDYATSADPHDGCGAERYRLGVRSFLGADLDPAEMYEWAWGDFHRLRAEIATTCAAIRPGASFAEIIELLDTDPNRAVHGAEAYQQWLQALTDEALLRSKQHFEIPPLMDRCEALIPPAGSAAAAYYTGPSEDFTRPGRTWYPTLGRTQFPMWGDVTTCYHESVPGHHLQIAYAKLQAASLSRIQRGSFISGHGEGWALYAEALCDEFGWFTNPDHRLGFLTGQMLRTVRVIIDIGMHLDARIPQGTTLNDGTPFHGGEVWTPDLAFEFAVAETGNTEEFMRSEIDRYLGWPAQAISYKIGQREWEAARADAQAHDGAAFDLKAWHTKALKLGAIGLDQLRAELAR
ncbi:MAG: DUF885 domain-containing protein [Actinomycetota bacterium]|nr:DUF885 domain-containing protein [Actinomycetota bacterium]